MPLQSSLKNWVLPKDRRSLTQYMVHAAFFIALSVVFTRFFSILLFGNALRLSIGMLPIVLSGFLLGPVYGGAVGLLADIIGQIIRSMGAPHPGILLNNVLYGVIPGLFVLVFSRIDRKVITYAIALCTLLLSALLQTRWVMSFTGLPFLAQLSQRLPGIAFNGVAVLVLALLLCPLLQRYQFRLLHRRPLFPPVE